jgi:riboflavin kinase/FMN adenylyltransferase
VASKAKNSGQSSGVAGARSVVTIGNFDGVHLGHGELLHLARDLAGEGGMVSVVTFEPLPVAFFRPELAPPRLTTVYQKLQLLAKRSVDQVWMMRFDGQLAGLSAAEFVQQVLVDGLAADHVVVGDDFRFGRGREGDIAMLTGLGQSAGFHVMAVPAILADGQRISSSRVRTALAGGDWALAEELLGRPFRMEGRVVRGAGLGRKLGYPTANLRVRARPSPIDGVLAAWSAIEGGSWLPAVCNLGNRPAVGGGEPLLEVHFFDLDEDLYGKRLEVQFVEKLRDELDFDTIDALIKQMQQDEAQARELLATKPRPAHNR